MKLALDKRLERGSMVDASGCRLWLGAPDHDGYGHLTYKGKQYPVHRLAWMDAHGPIPTGLCVCHTCDVRSCVNVDHLFLGTKADNNRDCQAKGRTNGYKKRGEANSWAKLTADKVRAILVDSREQKHIAADYGIDRTAVSLIKLRKRWAHISP